MQLGPRPASAGIALPRPVLPTASSCSSSYAGGGKVMEHVKLAQQQRGAVSAGRHGLGHGGGGGGRRSGVRCWVVAAALALSVTFAFIGITLWLGLNAATRLAPGVPVGDPFRDTSPSSSPPSSSFNAYEPPRNKKPPPVPSHEHPDHQESAPRERGQATRASAAESTTPKKRKGQIEKVRLDPAHTGSGKVVDSHAAEDVELVSESAERPSRTSSTTSSTSTTSTTSTTTVKAPEARDEELYTPEPIQETPTTKGASTSTSTPAPAGSSEEHAHQGHRMDNLPDHQVGVMTEEDALFPKLDASLENKFKEILQSGVPDAPPGPPRPPRLRPPGPAPVLPHRPHGPPLVWAPPPQWSPPTELRPPALPARRQPRPPGPGFPEARTPGYQHGDDLVADAALRSEWKQPADRREDPPQALLQEHADQGPDHYDGERPEEAENPLFNFLQDRMRALQEWLAAAGVGRDWQEMLQAVNVSMVRADPGVALRKLKEMYYSTSVEPDVPLASLVYPTDPAVLSNSSSLVSFGLLAFDLLLLRNVQLLARGEDGAAGQRAERLLRDPEVRALGALFLPPQEVQRQLQLQQGAQRQLQLADPTGQDPEDAGDPDSSQLAMRSDNSAPASGSPGAGGEPSSEDDSAGAGESGEEVTLSAVFQEVASFLTSGLRAVLNLARAYRATVAGARRLVLAQDRDGVVRGQGPGARESTSSSSSSASKGTPLDCLWTLYCRSLDKTARLTGPYGFLARMNGLGLRLLLGAVPIEKALDLLVKEATTGGSAMDCAQLFPRCSVEDAVPMVLDTALGRVSGVSGVPGAPSS